MSHDVEYNLNIELNQIHEWLKINQLPRNVKKVNHIIHKLGNKQVNNLLLKIDETVIERVQNSNLLGVTLQENLSWDIHIKYVNKMFQTDRRIKQIKKNLPVNIKVTLYNLLMLPYINHGLMGFNSDGIIKLQKKAVRIICLSKYNAHIEPYVKKLNILNVTDMPKLHELTLYYRYVYMTVPVYLHNLPLILNSSHI